TLVSAAPVAVGWGKKETQFHGSLGKEAALSKPEPASVVDCAPTDEQYELAWRDDGQYFVVSWSDSTVQHRRRFRVFTDSGELFSTSDTLNHWEPGLCWRPRIQLITAIQRRPKRGLDVIFFEINAERHGEFQLLDESIESMFRVHNMAFDEHGDVLAVLCTSTVEQPHTCLSFSLIHLFSTEVRLLTCSNYHWSVKRELLVDHTSTSLDDDLLPGCPVTFTWAVGAPRSGVFALHVANATRVKDRPDLTGTVIRCWSFSAAYDRNECMAIESCSRLHEEFRSPGFVASIDGEHIQLTAMAHSIIPPPMCASRLTFKQPTGFPNLFSKIAAVSFPGPWVVQRESNVVTILVQLESADFPARLFAVGLQCGTPGPQRNERFDCANDVLMEAEWITGAQNVIPWPRYVHAINLLDTTCPRENHRVNEILSRWSHVPVCGGKELSHFCWLSCSQFVFVACAGQLVGLVNWDLSDLSTTRVSWLLAVGSSISKPSTDHSNPRDSSLRICGLCLSIDEHRLCVQLTNGCVVIYSIEKLIVSQECHIVPSVEIEDNKPVFHELSSYTADCILRFPLACEQLVAVTFTTVTPRRSATTVSTKTTQLSTICTPTRSFLLGLHQPSHRLYGICIPVSSELVQTPTLVRQSKPAALLIELCSSILVLPNYLLVTSMRKLLVCVPTQFDATVCANVEVCMTELTSRLTIPSELLNSAQSISRIPQQQQAQSWYNDYLHPIETGTVLVSADPVDSKVVLQAARGNLEQVHPRALVLSHLANLLDNLKYAEALVFMRRHRVNFNLLHDHSPVLFRQNLNNLLEQVECTDLLTLFVSELVEDDVCKAMYGTFYGSPVAQLYRGGLSERNVYRLGPTQTTSKVNSVCDALLSEMANDRRYILTILTCYAKKRPSELHNALLLLEKFRADGDMTCWESGVRHLQYFATPPELYRVALGTYDLDLAQVMAQRTQLDPKEYLANLNELRAITDGDQMELRLAYQRFKIDDQLARYSEAIKQLKAAGKFCGSVFEV
ncbi:elongator complex protein 1, partial [Paragonimus westermani]